MTTEPKITELTAEYGSAALKPVFGPGVALVWKRHEDGSLLTNVLWQVRHHSPSGFEIGYGGSGPADLAARRGVLAEWAESRPARAASYCTCPPRTPRSTSNAARTSSPGPSGTRPNRN